MAVLDPVIVKRASDVAAALGEWGHVKALYVFGSAVTGNTDKWSDLDLAVFVDGLGQLDGWQRIRIVSEIQRKFGDDLDVHLFEGALSNGPLRGSFAEYVLKNGMEISFERS